MNIKRILCPIDYSESNQMANEYASILAQPHKATIYYLHIASHDVPYAAYAYESRDEEIVQEQKRLLEFKPTVPGVEASHVVMFGTPASAIVEYARENEIDLIVLGTHGRTGLMRAIMGSVSEAVVRKADCPVLALKSNSPVPEPESLTE